MQIDKEHRERLAHYCLVKKVTQEQAVNQIIGEGLQRAELDPDTKKRMDRAKEFKEQLASL